MADREDYRDRLRKRIRDWPKRDALGAAIANTTITTFTATIGALYEKGGVVRVDSEEMLVRDINATTITVIRGWNGTTAATHLISAAVDIFQFFSDEELNQVLEGAIRGLWPDVFAKTVDTTLTLTIGTYLYDVPAAVTNAQGIIVDLEYYTDSDSRGNPIAFEVWGGKIYVPAPGDGTARIWYVYPYAVPTDDTTDLAIPSQFDRLILLDAEAEALQTMMIDRSKYEKYVTSQWHENVSGYELESHLDQAQKKAELEREKMHMGMPSHRRYI